MPSHLEVKSYWSVYVNSPKPEWNEKGRRHAQDTGESTRSALGNDVAGQMSGSCQLTRTPAVPPPRCGNDRFLAWIGARPCRHPHNAGRIIAGGSALGDTQ